MVILNVCYFYEVTSILLLDEDAGPNQNKNLQSFLSYS